MRSTTRRRPASAVVSRTTTGAPWPAIVAMRAPSADVAIRRARAGHRSAPRSAASTMVAVGSAASPVTTTNRSLSIQTGGAATTDRSSGISNAVDTRRVDQHDPDVVAGRQVAAERRVAAAPRIPGREVVGSTVRGRRSGRPALTARHLSGLPRWSGSLVAVVPVRAGPRRGRRPGPVATQVASPLGSVIGIGSSPLSSQPTSVVPSAFATSASRPSGADSADGCPFEQAPSEGDAGQRGARRRRARQERLGRRRGRVVAGIGAASVPRRCHALIAR